MENEHKLLIVNGKKIFICEEHHHVLKFWYEFKHLNPYLLTFDYHTDLHRGFQHYLGTNYESQGHWDIAQSELIKKVASNDFSTILKLTHAEHIDTSIKAGFIKKALVYSYDRYANKPERVYNINGDTSYNGQLIINNSCDEGKILTIESKELEQNFRRFDLCLPMNEWCNNFILDIDLDFFKTKQSIKSKDASFFKMLINKSIAISIAKESIFIEDWKRKYDKSLTVEFLLDSFLQLVG